MHSIEIKPVTVQDYFDLATMVGELLKEIMEITKIKSFSFNHGDTQKRAGELIARNKYWIFIAKEKASGDNLGFISLYESYALYSEGAFGTIPELYVRPPWRSQNIGKRLLDKSIEFSSTRDWNRLEVTTPPLPEFSDTLRFYQSNGFSISGGRKLRREIK
jgi:GNAT superfamily N-acetyltransferase